MASFRLNKVAKDFNVGIQTLAEYLAKKGHQVEPSPNTKISEEQYELLATAFQSERKVKEEADKIEMMATGANRIVEISSKQELDVEPEEVIIKGYSTAKAAAPAEEPKPEVEEEEEPVKKEEPEAEKTSQEEEGPEAPVVETVEPKEEEESAPEAPADANSPFKVVGTVDLSAINQRMRPDKKKKKKGEKHEPESVLEYLIYLFPSVHFVFHSFAFNFAANELSFPYYTTRSDK